MLRIESMKLPNGKTVNFSLDTGDGIIIRGKNGSGKSLLLKSMALLCMAPYKHYDYKGQSVSELSAQVFRSEVLYVSTTPLMMKDQNVEEFFNSVRNLHVYKNHVSDFDYKHYLEKWHIPMSDVSYLSSGQRQMISFLRALTLNAKVLLLDEPTANLDHEKTLEIERLILDWKQRTSGSVIMISHSSDQINRLNFRVVDFESLVTVL
jgi:ABC-type iron transport system FetAB ATPase subunit